jgi:hypothetical protein
MSLKGLAPFRADGAGETGIGALLAVQGLEHHAVADRPRARLESIHATGVAGEEVAECRREHGARHFGDGERGSQASLEEREGEAHVGLW